MTFRLTLTPTLPACRWGLKSQRLTPLGKAALSTLAGDASLCAPSKLFWPTWQRGETRVALSFFSRMVGPYSALSSRAVLTPCPHGILNHLIQALGRWPSSAYQSYICTPSETLVSLSSHLIVSSVGLWFGTHGKCAICLGVFWVVAQVPRHLCSWPLRPQSTLGVVFGWLLLAELPWMPVCPAQGLWLKACCSPWNHRPLWGAPSPSSCIGDEFNGQ